MLTASSRSRSTTWRSGKTRWSLVIEKTDAGRETEHRQYAAIGEPFAQSLLHEAWVSRSGRNLRYERRSDPSKSYGARALVASQSRSNHAARRKWPLLTAHGS